jgi:hypothetical protein
MVYGAEDNLRQDRLAARIDSWPGKSLEHNTSGTTDVLRRGQWEADTERHSAVTARASHVVIGFARAHEPKGYGFSLSKQRAFAKEFTMT